MLMPSWKAPSFVAPSPVKQTATRGSRFILKARAMPVAMGMPPPTMAMAGTMPLARSPSASSRLCPCSSRWSARQLAHRRADVDAVGQASRAADGCW